MIFIYYKKTNLNTQADCVDFISQQRDGAIGLSTRVNGVHSLTVLPFEINNKQIPTFLRRN